MAYIKVVDALKVIQEYGGTDGAHHKQWVLDQVVRILAGDSYEEWVRHYEYRGEAGKIYEWEIGTAP